MTKDELFSLYVKQEISEKQYERRVRSIGYKEKIKKLNIGARVIGIGKHDGAKLEGILGTIRKNVPGSEYISVEWDEQLVEENGNLVGHDLSGTLSTDTGWNVQPDCVKLLEEGEE